MTATSMMRRPTWMRSRSATEGSVRVLSLLAYFKEVFDEC